MNLRHELAVALGAERAATLDVRNQGTAAVVVGDVAAIDLLTVDGVEGAQRVTPDTHAVWGSPGRYFGEHDPVHRGDHGSSRTRRQLAVVGGGHPHASSIAAKLAQRPPRVTEWAGWIAEAAGLAWRPAPLASPGTPHGRLPPT